MHKKLSSKDGLKIIFGWVLPEGPVNQKKSRAEQKQIRVEQSRSRAEQQNRAERAETLSTKSLKFDHHNTALHFPRSRMRTYKSGKGQSRTEADQSRAKQEQSRTEQREQKR
jgi:hypothetical protein